MLSKAKPKYASVFKLYLIQFRFIILQEIRCEVKLRYCYFLRPHITESHHQ
jgi:hypothetical protein